MNGYELAITEEFYDDLELIIELKKEYGMYQSNIDKFKKDVDNRLVQLTMSPKSGANLSSRVNKETAIKYFVISDCLMFFEIVSSKKVEVLRILSAKSDWISKIF